MATDDYTATELMVAAAARSLADGEVVFVGIGLPNLACNLARRLHAPNLVLIYESGAVGAVPDRLPISIGDPALVTNSAAVAPMSDVFFNMLQGGRIDVGFLQGSQIDRRGNINTTVIGDYARPKVRLPGSGGACEIAIHARRVVVVAPQDRRSFPERVDFVTSPAGPRDVVTDLGRYAVRDGELTLTSLHPGRTLDDVRAAIGWDVRVAADLATTEPPTPEELRLLRTELR